MFSCDSFFLHCYLFQPCAMIQSCLSWNSTTGRSQKRSRSRKWTTNVCKFWSTWFFFISFLIIFLGLNIPLEVLIFIMLLYGFHKEDNFSCFTWNLNLLKTANISFWHLKDVNFNLFSPSKYKPVFSHWNLCTLQLCSLKCCFGMDDK